MIHSKTTSTHNIAIVMEALYAFWNSKGRVRPTIYKLPYKDDRKWRKILDINEWITYRTDEGVNLANAVDALFAKNVERPRHPNVHVTLGVCKLRQALILTDNGRRVHTLFASSYWDEQGQIISCYLGDETSDTEIKAALHYFANISLNRLHRYSKNTSNYWDFSPWLTAAILTLGESSTPTTPSIVHVGETLDEDSTEEEAYWPGEEPQLPLDGSLWLMGSPAAPSMDSPRASSRDWLRKLVAGGNSEEALHWTLEEELPLDMAGTMMTEQPSLTSTDWETDGYWTDLLETWRQSLKCI
jgi:hypothetical protein